MPVLSLSLTFILSLILSLSLSLSWNRPLALQSTTRTTADRQERGKKKKRERLVRRSKCDRIHSKAHYSNLDLYSPALMLSSPSSLLFPTLTIAPLFDCRFIYCCRLRPCRQPGAILTAVVAQSALQCTLPSLSLFQTSSPWSLSVNLVNCKVPLPLPLSIEHLHEHLN